MSVLRPGGKLEFEVPCVECTQPVYFTNATHSKGFGHLADTEGLKVFIRDGVCQWCDEILADFEAYSHRKDLAP